ncbi:MAG: hypothetical protein ABGX04_07615 [Myxococcales bacterium]
MIWKRCELLFELLGFDAVLRDEHDGRPVAGFPLDLAGVVEVMAVTVVADRA